MAYHDIISVRHTSYKALNQFLSYLTLYDCRLLGICHSFDVSGPTEIIESILIIGNFTVLGASITQMCEYQNPELEITVIRDTLLSMENKDV